MSAWRGLADNWRALPRAVWASELSQRLRRWRPARGWLFLGLALAALTGVVLMLLPWMVRREVVRQARELDIAASIGGVRLGLGRLWLLDVELSDLRDPGRRAHIDALEVRPSLRAPLALGVYGAQVRLAGSAAALRTRWRSRLESEKATTGREVRAARSLWAEGVDVTWTLPGGADSLRLWGIRAAQDEQGAVAGSVDRMRLASRRLRADVRAVSLDLARVGKERRAQRIEAAEATLRVEIEGPHAKASDKEQASAALGATQALENQPESEWKHLRSRIETSTDQRFRAVVVALSIEAHRAGEALRMGPSQFSLTRDGNRLSAAIAPHAVTTTGSGTPVNVRAELPLGDGPIEFDLSGGPVSLSALGVREGDFGLMGVRDARLEADAHVVLDQALSHAQVTSKGRLENLRLRRAALASSEIRGVRVGWRFNGGLSLDGSDLSVKEAEVSFGDVRLEFSGKVQRRPERSVVEILAEVPVAACGTLIESLPRAMAPLLEGVRMQGTFAVQGSLNYDSEKPGAIHTRLIVNNQCRIAEVPPAISPNRFRSVWTREVMGPDGLPMSLESGPGSADFTPYEEISPYLETAIVVCEDAGFFRHQGLDYRAIESSVKQNLVAGRFLRGASTVSMQLAKNLYLGREKTLSRKLQEAVLTLLLEQELSKHELMELYLNVIEFGPGVYGVRQAARYYFNEEPRDLSLAQALYLGSILPNPDSQHFLPDGRVSRGWSEYLRKLMHVARKIGRISPEELERGLLEQVEFRKPSAESDRSSGINADADSETDLDAELPLPPSEVEARD